MTSGPVRVEFDAGRLNITWPGLAGLLQMVGSCRLTSGAMHHTDGWRREAGSNPVFRATCGPVDLELQLRPEAERVNASLAASANADCEVLELGWNARAVVEEVAAAWFQYSGYQSWDRAGVHRLDQLGSAPESWWIASLASDRGGGVAAAAGGCKRWATRFGHRHGELNYVQSSPPGVEGPEPLWRAKAGERWQGEELSVAGSSDVRSALGGLTGAPSQPRGIKGWLSWYRYGPWVDRKDVVENAAFLAEPSMQELGYRVVQIDDGWQQAYGDWSPNGRFTELDELVERLRGAGQVAGVWTAPFFAGLHSRLVESAPDDWFLRDDEGRRLIDPRPGLPDVMQLLDSRNPEVRRHLRETFARLHQAGFRYFKIDYLYAGAYAGLEAFRLALDTIREAIGDSYLLACGAPLMPVVGVVQGCRIGEDTARPIYNFETGNPQPSVFGDEVQWAARNLAARHALKHWFELDADIAVVGGNLPVSQARQLVTLVAISGGPFFATDDLANLPAERLDLLRNPEVLGLVGRAAAVPDWEPNERDVPPSVWRLGEEILAIFNWSAQEREMKVALPGRCRLRDLWRRSDAGVAQDSIELVLPPDGVKLLALERG